MWGLSTGIFQSSQVILTSNRVDWEHHSNASLMLQPVCFLERPKLRKELISWKHWMASHLASGSGAAPHQVSQSPCVCFQLIRLLLPLAPCLAGSLFDAVQSRLTGLIAVPWSWFYSFSLWVFAHSEDGLTTTPLHLANLYFHFRALQPRSVIHGPAASALSWAFVRNVESQASLQSYWIRTFILTRPQSDSYLHKDLRSPVF